MDNICGGCLREIDKKEKAVIGAMEELKSFSLKDDILIVIMKFQKHSLCNHKFCSNCVDLKSEEKLKKINEEGKTCKLCAYVFGKHLEIYHFFPESNTSFVKKNNLKTSLEIVNEVKHMSVPIKDATSVTKVPITGGIKIGQIRKILKCYEMSLKYQKNELNETTLKLMRLSECIRYNILYGENEGRNNVIRYREMHKENEDNRKNVEIKCITMDNFLHRSMDDLLYRARMRYRPYEKNRFLKSMDNLLDRDFTVDNKFFPIESVSIIREISSAYLAKCPSARKSYKMCTTRLLTGWHIGSINTLFLYALASSYYNKPYEVEKIINILVNSLLCIKEARQYIHKSTEELEKTKGFSSESTQFLNSNEYIETLFKIAAFINSREKNKECIKTINRSLLKNFKREKSEKNNIENVFFRTVLEENKTPVPTLKNMAIFQEMQKKYGHIT